MNPIRNFVDKIKPGFEKGGKLHMFYSFFDAIEVFLFVPNKVTKTGSHIRDHIDMKRTMIVVMIATIPALLFGMYNTGYQHFLSIGTEPGFWTVFFHGFLKVLPLIVVAYVAGLGTEIIVAQLRGHDVFEGFFVTGFLIPLILPADVPLWMVAVATIFAVVIGKEVFGGTGMNIVNPALLTRAFLFFAYPTKMSGDLAWVSGLAKGEGVVDGFSGATPLGEAAAENISSMPGLGDMFFGFYPGSIGETSTLAILIGAAILLYTGVASWKIMIPVFIGGISMTLILNLFAVNPLMELTVIQQLCLGGFAFGAVFMATDPVTASQTNTGKYIYGFLIGFLAILIRVLNPAYPEGVMLAILLMNVFAPLIDHYVVQANIKRRLKRATIKA